ncbi:MAG: enolase C-terminal domain-like protein [Candidatus Pacearchaeota archaeon]
MKPKQILAKVILNSRKEKTIEVIVKTEYGNFSASAPTGRSKGSYEKDYYKDVIEKEAKKLESFSNKICEINIEHFTDLQYVENILKGFIGANTIYSLEVALLKAAAAEQGKSLWQFLNPNAKKFPIPIGNCVGGGSHSLPFKGKKLDFQEFLIIPRCKNFSNSVYLMKKVYNTLRDILKARRVLGQINDENALTTSLNNEETLELLNKIRFQIEKEHNEKIEIGLDVAANSFYDKSSKTYNYKNPETSLTREEQIEYISGLVENYELSYLEDPLEENDFEGFGMVKDRVGNCLVVGDDLTVTQINRLLSAIKFDSINAIIIKPNQCGSLLEVNKVLKLARKYNLKVIFSHRSGETLDYTIADLAFASGADFIKTGIYGKEREIKLNRLINIEKEIK